MDKRKVAMGSVMAVLLAVAATWAFGLLGGSDPAVAKLQEIGDQLNDSNLPESQRDALRDQFRTQMRAMTDDQRHAFFDANRGQWEARSAQRMDEFFALSKAEQNKRLDEIIDRAAGQQRPGQGQNANRDGGNLATMNESQREERSKRRLDSTSPRLRAQYSEFRKMLDSRASQRGVKLDNGWGRGPGRRAG